MSGAKCCNEVWEMEAGLLDFCFVAVVLLFLNAHEDKVIKLPFFQQNKTHTTHTEPSIQRWPETIQKRMVKVWKVKTQASPCQHK